MLSLFGEIVLALVGEFIGAIGNVIIEQRVQEWKAKRKVKG